MKEQILKLIEEYKRREELMSSVIRELEKEIPKNESQIKTANNTRLFWKIVIKDLEKLLR